MLRKPLTTAQYSTRKKPALKDMKQKENRARDNSYDGEMARLDLSEFLRLESLALADLSSNERQYHRDDLEKVATGGHLWLVGCGPRPKDPPTFQGPSWNLPVSLRSDFAVFELPIGQANKNPYRVVLSIDPLQPDELLLDKVKTQIHRARKTIFNRKRALGGGRPLPFFQMWTALQLYRRSKQYSPKRPLKTLTRLSEDQADKQIALAKRMIKASSSGRHAWAKLFPLR